MATQNRLRAMLRLHLDLSYAKFWQTIDREFTRDHEGARRRDWEAVKPPKGHLTLTGWRTYRTAFEMALSLVVKYSEREVEEKVLQDLPEAWRDTW